MSAQLNSAAVADAQTAATLTISTELATQVLATAAVEAGLSQGVISGVSMVGTSISGALVAPDGRAFTVEAKVVGFTVESGRAFTVGPN